jgi:hypothetical protein
MARSIKAAYRHQLEKQKLATRIAVLEDAIRTHRRVVRDGWVSRWRPDRCEQPNEHLWKTIKDEQ